ncbi:YkgJ family cysteine cluster protein [Roseateles oligotrophus]|uniref:YkgJ family cysteine cluster protein n=1 Tax=Roseateles oligotrophus TaxID=1769250 RepID=UPI001618CDA1|nr:YkgJ family cysteine cluster protein [Roseateles oligotrophus]
MFPCDGCGLCCRHVDRSDITRHMDRGDGACVYIEGDMVTCKIYDNRPEFCRVDDSYKIFAGKLSLIEYYKENVAICNALRAEHGFDYVSLVIKDCK